MPTYLEKPSALLQAMRKSLRKPGKIVQVGEVASKLASFGGLVKIRIEAPVQRSAAPRTQGAARRRGRR